MPGDNHREPLEHSTLEGIWYSLLVPWNDRGELDEAGFENEIRSSKAGGVAGVYTGGTTGEFYAQDDATFEQVTAIACRTAHAIGLPVQIGVTTLSTRWTIQRIRIAERYRANAVQVALPFWLKLRDDEAVRFMHDLANACPSMPLVFYQANRAKLLLPPAVLIQLAREIPTFIGMKDTQCSIDVLRATLEGAPDLSIFGGDGDLLQKTVAGGRGAYSAVAGFIPRQMVELYRLASAGEIERAGVIQNLVRRLLDEAILPICVEHGLQDSAIDRIQRVAGGYAMSLTCALPYRSGTEAHVNRILDWCKAHAPELIKQP